VPELELPTPPEGGAVLDLPVALGVANTVD
jgi:hypothetical protein